MSIIRVEKTKNYTMMSNHHLRNMDLSLKAKGLLSLILSLPDDWQHSIIGYTKLTKDGRESITNSIKELEKAGYITRRQLKNKNGQFGHTEYTVFETPRATTEVVKPLHGNLHTVNTTQLNTKELITKTNNNIYNKYNNIYNTPLNITMGEYISEQHKIDTQTIVELLKQKFNTPVLLKAQEQIQHSLTLVSYDLLIQGIRIALQNGVNNLVSNFAYVERMVINWSENGVTDLETYKVRAKQKQNCVLDTGEFAHIDNTI